MQRLKFGLFLLGTLPFLFALETGHVSEAGRYACYSQFAGHQDSEFVSSNGQRNADVQPFDQLGTDQIKPGYATAGAFHG